jgi:hypothetical protein
VITPDYVEPLVAYRVWGWDSTGLKSLNGAMWFPGQPMAANCKYINLADDVAARLNQPDFRAIFPGKNPWPGHGPIPGDNCACGIYAAKDARHLGKIGYSQYGICGQVSLWGKVSVHELGYRAEYAYPKNLAIPASFLPVKAAAMEARIENLTAYNVPMQLQAFVAYSLGFDGLVDLWTPETGYNSETLDWLIERAKLPNVPLGTPLSVGDRVAVPKYGIGIVQGFNEDGCVELRLWNTSLAIVAKSAVKWDETNWRWEVAETGYLSVRTFPRSAR